MLGVLAGFAAGAALGILFAPGKGSNARKNISRRTEDLVDALNDKLEKKFDELVDVVKGK